MSGDASSYAALGLEPDADAAAVDRAYRKLIKQYHPDRVGGDARRATEINRAYRELRDMRSVKDALLFHDDPFDMGAKGWRRIAFAAAAGFALLIVTGSMARHSQGAPPATAAAIDFPRDEVVADASAWDDALDENAVNAAIRDAMRIAGRDDEMALAETSRDCHARMRRQPSLAQLDRCAAFDDAVVQLQDRDPLRDQGPFSELAVTGRQMSGATLLSNDYLAIDGRLDRIRLKVELTLAPVVLPSGGDPAG